MSVIISIVIGYLLDMLIGTPKFIKKIRAAFASMLKKFLSKFSSKAFIVVVLVILALFSGGVYALLRFIEYYNMIASILAESIICYICISCKDIKNNAERVHRALKRGYIKNATRLFNTITEEGEINEPKEIAENIIVMTADFTLEQVVAPIFYILLFGGAGGVCYKLIVIINECTGRIFPRVLKNLSEFIPVRIGVIFMLISEKLLGMDCKNALKIFKRDRYNVKSLNRGLVLSLCAGGLGVCFDLKKSKAKIGDPKNDINHNHIKKIYEMINIASLLTLVSLVVIRIIIVLFVA